MSLFGQSHHLHHWTVTAIVLTLIAGCSSMVPRPSTGESSKLPTLTVTTPNLTASTQRDATWSKLQRGESGYVVMIRHALAPGTGDPSNFRVDDCSTQRNLSAEGRAQAVRMGEAFRRRQIRVAKILSSQWCRCLETAKLMNLGLVEPFEALNSFFSNPSAEAKQTEQVRQLIVNNRDTQGVVILITHQVNITALTDVVPRSGEAVVLQANQGDRVEFIGGLEGL
jgi:phosphohistidine phosphatase SixA